MNLNRLPRDQAAYGAIGRRVLDAGEHPSAAAKAWANGAMANQPESTESGSERWLMSGAVGGTTGGVLGNLVAKRLGRSRVLGTIAGGIAGTAAARPLVGVVANALAKKRAASLDRQKELARHILSGDDKALHVGMTATDEVYANRSRSPLRDKIDEHLYERMRSNVTGE